MAELTTEGHFVFTTLDEFGRRRISNTLLDDGTIVVYAVAVAANPTISMIMVD